MGIYIFLFLLIFIINIIPVFMPPTWIVLSFFYIHYHLLFLPTLLIGVIAATLGRVVLALLARSGFIQRFLPKDFLTNYAYLGTYLKQNQKITVPVVFVYGLSPISSNVLFIVAGFSKLNLTEIAISFSLGRLISYAFLIKTSNKISGQLTDIFTGNFSIGTVISVIISLLVIIIMGKINWSKILTVKSKK